MFDVRFAKRMAARYRKTGLDKTADRRVRAGGDGEGGVFRAKFRVDDEHQSASTRTTGVFVDADGDWLIAHEHRSSLVAGSQRRTACREKPGRFRAALDGRSEAKLVMEPGTKPRVIETVTAVGGCPRGGVRGATRYIRTRFLAGNECPRHP